MCFTQEMSGFFSVGSILMAIYGYRKYENRQLAIAILYFGAMETLQFVQYFFVARPEDDYAMCGDSTNQFLTVLGGLHICFQPISLTWPSSVFGMPVFRIASRRISWARFACWEVYGAYHDTWLPSCIRITQTWRLAPPKTAPTTSGWAKATIPISRSIRPISYLYSQVGHSTSRLGFTHVSSFVLLTWCGFAYVSHVRSYLLYRPALCKRLTLSHRAWFGGVLDCQLERTSGSLVLLFHLSALVAGFLHAGSARP